MKTAILVGYHGHKNLGDDMFLRVIIKWLKEKLEVNMCTVSAKQGTIDSELYGVTLKAMEPPIKKISRSLWLAIFMKSMKSDYLIFSAGSIFTIQPFFIVYITLRILRFIRGDFLNIMAVGVSLGPYRSRADKYWCLKALDQMNYVMLRDKKSAEILGKSGVSVPYKLSYDLALSWTKMYPGRNVRQMQQGDVIGLALTSRGFGLCTENNHSHNCNAITKALTEATKEYSNARVKIFGVCNDDIDGDFKLCRHIEQRLLSAGVRAKIVMYGDGKIDPYLDQLRDCKLLIASRMHAGIMATLGSIPVFQISYAEKIMAFYEHCDLSKNYIRINDDVSDSAITEFISLAMSGKLKDFADSQNVILRHKADLVYRDLMELKQVLR